MSEPGDSSIHSPVTESPSDDAAYSIAPGIAAFVRGSEGMELVSAQAVWRMPTSSALLVLRIFSVPRTREQALAMVTLADRPTLARLIDGALANGFLVRGGDVPTAAAADSTRWLEPHGARGRELTGRSAQRRGNEPG